MWKIIAVICILEWPDYTMNSELVCTMFEDSTDARFLTKEECDKSAIMKYDNTLDTFKKYRETFESLEVACVKTNNEV